jgi:transcriptional regulator with XRE-family HTH domain
MAFHEAFSDLRKRRRIPMRLFEEEATVSRSYIHGIEQGKLLPSPEKLEQLASVFVKVAKEQEAVDPEADGRMLSYERERTEVIDRLGFDPNLADSLVLIRNMNQRQRADLALPLAEALKLFEQLDAKEQSSIGLFIQEMAQFLERLDDARRKGVVVQLIEAFISIREQAEGTTPQDRDAEGAGAAAALDRSGA